MNCCLPYLDLQSNRRDGEEDEFARLVNALQEVIAKGRDTGSDWLVPFVIATRWVGTRRDETRAE